MMKKYLELCNRQDELSKVVGFVEELGDEFQLSCSLVMNINLVLEEAIANIIMYAYPHEDGEHTIHLTAEKKDKELIFLLTDKGTAFDPTQVAEADVTLSAEERPIGGLGIFLIRKIMEEVSWQRIDGENQLKMIKNIM